MSSLSPLWLIPLLVFAPAVAQAKDELPVYYASALPAKARQDAVKTELAKVSLDAVVFAKFKDFSQEVKAKNPTLLIAPSFFQRFYPEYEPVLRFSSSGGQGSKYLLLSLSEKWNPKNLSQGKLGIVEEVDRDHLKELASELLGTKVKMIKSVSKPEDLFPLLVFRAADFILISPENYKVLREKFTTKVYTIGESKRVSGAAVFVKKGQKPEQVIKSLAALPEDVVKSLGFSKVEPVVQK